MHCLLSKERCNKANPNPELKSILKSTSVENIGDEKSEKVQPSL
ncbi:hypothetical protein [Wolbachia endosymbiont of Ctenocephalides felis wCfeT]|nr:hypothetical protein [Wolbachia endosymbiont of Ctenocephalides felis wCfeT]